MENFGSTFRGEDQSTPIPGRITDAIGPSIDTYRWALETAPRRFGSLNVVSINCLVSEVLQEHGRTLGESETLTLDAFELILRKKRKAQRRKAKAAPDLRKVLTGELKVLERDGIRSVKAIVDHLKTPAGKQLGELVREILERWPDRKKTGKTRTQTDVIEAALQANRRPNDATS